MEKKKRLKNLFFVAAALFAVAVGYYLLYIYFPVVIFRCVFHEITGLNCPGCGITRMIYSFFKLKFVEGIQYNIFLGVTFPFIFYVIGYECYLYLGGKKSNKAFNVICCVYVVMLVLWGFVRNLIGC